MVEERRPDIIVITLSVIGILALSLFLQHEFALKQSLLFLIGAGLGICLMHALFGFTGGWRFFIRDRNSASVRAQILLLAVTSILFFPVIGNVFPEISGNAALGPVGISVLVGAFLFGIGMQLGGGCGSGTLYTVGWGHTDMLITLAFFIIGATIGSAHLHWWLTLPNIGKVSLIAEMGWLPALLTQLIVFAGLYFLVRYLDLKKNTSIKSITLSTDSTPVSQRLILGPWPLIWGVVGLAVFNLLTMLVAGHPWSITFAFGLWGTKIWNALGGDISSWQYWSSGYPARALNSSVLRDTTSIMDFGIIIGAMLASALAGKFSPEGKIKAKRVLTAVVGGLLLGYGARLAFGCNIGALLAGISTGSLHGWLWLVAAFAGSILGIYIKIWMGIDRPIKVGTR
ncbi:YeeE/YedE family protein [Kaarinaea lacus]